jgi:sulfatase modifying factor 1
MGNRPVNFVSWFNAARVANWMHNGAQTYGSTDATASAPQNTGAYTLGTATSGNAPAKNSGALYWLPTENEWYKAAYYSPVKGGVGSPGYYLYGNGFDSGIATVTADSSGNGSAGTGIMGSGTGNFANFDFGAGNVTTVGTNGAASYYGAFDMSGNVWDWNDLDGVSGSSRGLRGGSWRDNASDVSSAARATNLASGGRNDFIGFRLASVPEPATLGMASGGALCAGGWWVLKRRRKRA